MSVKTETVDTYNKSAAALAKKFNAIGARVEDIEYVFSYCGKSNPFVLEIGCGNGRDAQEIIKRTNNYLGVDISQELLSIAQKSLPETIFTVADVEDFVFPKNIDIVFAFASLIHVPKESFLNIMGQLFGSVTKHGLVFVSLKYSDVYEQVTKEDEFGTRTYWHYSQSDVQNLVAGFTVAHTSIQEIAGQMWIDVLYQK